jgi:hypothetical protein
MADTPPKTPYDVLARFLPLTPEDEANAKRLGATPDEYRTIKLHGQVERAQQAAPADSTPPDIAAEAAEAQRLRREPGILKPSYTTPNVLVQAAKTPGEVAQMILFVFCYLAAMILIVALGGERVQKMPGIFQCIGLGVLVIPVMWLSSRIWAALGEGLRDVLRTLVRIWPLTLIALLFGLGLLKLLLARLH